MHEERIKLTFIGALGERTLDMESWRLYVARLRSGSRWRSTSAQWIRLDVEVDIDTVDQALTARVLFAGKGHNVVIAQLTVLAVEILGPSYASIGEAGFAQHTIHHTRYTLHGTRYTIL